MVSGLSSEQSVLISFLYFPHLISCKSVSVLAILYIPHLFLSFHRHVLYKFGCHSAYSIHPHLVFHILTTVLSVLSVLHLVLHILTFILFVQYLVMYAMANILSVPDINNLSCIFCLLGTLCSVL